LPSGSRMYSLNVSSQKKRGWLRSLSVEGQQAAGAI
jgi:hypothetical protein